MSVYELGHTCEYCGNDRRTKVLENGKRCCFDCSFFPDKDDRPFKIPREIIHG
jgi:hypothetical protein